MKKALSILAALTLASVICSAADGTIYLNNYDANGGAGAPIYYLNNTTLANSSFGVTIQVLGGPVGGTLVPIAKSGTSNANLSLFEPGFFDSGFGVVPGVAEGATGEFKIRAWTGNDYASADARAESASWTQKVGTNPAPPSPPVPESLQMPGSLTLTPVPEPSTIALGLLGAALLLIRRRS